MNNEYFYVNISCGVVNAHGLLNRKELSTILYDSTNYKQPEGSRGLYFETKNQYQVLVQADYMNKNQEDNMEAQDAQEEPTTLDIPSKTIDSEVPGVDNLYTKKDEPIPGIDVPL